MIRKKEVIAALSIVTIAFLLGTVIMTAMGGGWREYLELWEAIRNLQSQIDTIELIPGPKGEKGDPGPPGICIVEFNDIGSVPDIPIDPMNLGSVTLNVEDRPGSVILTVTATAITFGDETVCVLGLGTMPGSTDLHETRAGVLDGTGTQRRDFSLTSRAVVPVTPGVYTFYAIAWRPSVFSAHPVNLADVYLTAVFCET